MGLWSRFTQAFARKSGGGGFENWFGAFGPGGSTSSGVYVNQFTAMQSAAVMACVSILAEDVAKLRLQVWRRQKDGGKIAAKDHFLYNLLRQPNDWQTQFEFVEMMQVALLLRSNAYAVILRDNRGTPTALVPINPDRVTIYEAAGGEIFYMVSRQGLHDAAVLEHVPLMIPSEDIFHLRWLSQSSSLLGLSRIALMREPVGLILSQEQLAARISGSGARLGGVLQTDQKLHTSTIERLRQDWSDKYEGLRNAGKTAILEQGLKFQQNSMTAADAQFILQREFQLQEIARAFRMPPHKLGVIARGTASTMAQQDQDYANNTITSYLERWEQKIEKTFDLDGETIFVKFDMSRFLRADIKTRYDAYRSALLSMWIKPNEVRRAEDLPDDPDGDSLMQPTNMAPLGFVPKGNEPGPGSDVTGAPALGGSGDTPLPAGDEGPSS